MEYLFLGAATWLIGYMCGRLYGQEKAYGSIERKLDWLIESDNQRYGEDKYGEF